MAAIKTVDGEYIILPAERAVRWWKILNCEVEPTKEEAVKASRIERVMLNRYNPSMPQSYLDAHPYVEEDSKRYSRVFSVKGKHQV